GRVPSVPPRRSSDLGTEKRPGRAGFWARLMRHRLAAAGLVFVILMVAATVLGPILSPYDPNEMNFLHISQPPSRQFPLGTDELGDRKSTRLNSSHVK